MKYGRPTPNTVTPPHTEAPEELFHQLGDPQHSQGQAESIQAPADRIAKIIFLISVTNVEGTVPGKSEGQQPATRQFTQHRGQGGSASK